MFFFKEKRKKSYRDIIYDNFLVCFSYFFGIKIENKIKLLTKFKTLIWKSLKWKRKGKYIHEDEFQKFFQILSKDLNSMIKMIFFYLHFLHVYDFKQIKKALVNNLTVNTCEKKN